MAMGLLVFTSCSQDGKNSNQFAKIEYTSSGCTHFDQSELIIEKQDSDFIAKLMSEGKLLRKLYISNVQLDSVKSFIYQLKNFSSSAGCTTNDYYLVSYQNEKIKRIDGSCDWDGYNNLVRFLIKNARYGK